MVKYWDRLKPEMDARQMEVADLARAIGVSFQAVAKVRDGGSFGSANNFKAAKFFGLTPEWLATGKGAKHRQDVTPPGGEASVPDVAVSAPVAGEVAVFVPVLSTSASMGPGSDQNHDEVVIGRMTLSPSWVSKAVNPTHISNLRFIHGYGDSMDPTFKDGDVLLVDSGVQETRVDAVYVLEANDRLYIKRVRQRIDGSFEISSDNPTVKTVDVLNGDSPVMVKGRVVWVWNGKRL